MVAVLYRPGQMDAGALRLLAFVAALGVYAMLGSPTPDNPGVAELVVALGLVLAVGIPAASGAVRFDSALPLWESAGRLLLLFGLSMPLLTGMVRGHDPGLMLRDLAPFMFMLLPVFLVGLFRARPDYFHYALGGILVLGLAFSLRATADHVQFALSFLQMLPEAREMTYLANMPTVLFAALFLAGAGAQRFVTGRRFKDSGVGMALLALALIVFVPLVLTAQRASLGYAALYAALLAALWLWKYPYRTAFLLAILLALLVPVYGILADIAGAMIHKTALVGFNMRLEELAAVWAAISESPMGLIFGTGWGGTFDSPAVGGVRVNFTHSLLSSALLKTGLAGLAFVVVYLAGLAMILWRNLHVHPVLVLALAGPVAIDVFLYASFKSLDFGLVLLLIAALDFSHRNLAGKPGTKLHSARL